MPPGDPLLERNLIPLAVACPTGASACSREWTKDPFVPKSAGGAGGIGRLEERVADVVVRRRSRSSGPVSHSVRGLGRSSRSVSALEPVLVDELLDGLARRAGWSGTARAGPPEGRRPRASIVAARQEHGPRQVERTQEGREDAGSGVSASVGSVGRYQRERAMISSCHRRRSTGCHEWRALATPRAPQCAARRSGRGWAAIRAIWDIVALSRAIRSARHFRHANRSRCRIRCLEANLTPPVVDPPTIGHVPLGTFR